MTLGSNSRGGHILPPKIPDARISFGVLPEALVVCVRLPDVLMLR